MRAILKNCHLRNQFNAKFTGQCLVFSSWKQLVEVSLSEYMKKSGKEWVVYEMLEILIQRQNSEETRLGLATLISSAVAVLVTKLR